MIGVPPDIPSLRIKMAHAVFCVVEFRSMGISVVSCLLKSFLDGLDIRAASCEVLMNDVVCWRVGASSSWCSLGGGNSGGVVHAISLSLFWRKMAKREREMGRPLYSGSEYGAFRGVFDYSYLARTAVGMCHIMRPKLSHPPRRPRWGLVQGY